MKNITFEDIVEVFGEKKDLEAIVNQGMIINQLFMWMPRFLVRPRRLLCSIYKLYYKVFSNFLSVQNPILL